MPSNYHKFISAINSTTNADIKKHCKSLIEQSTKYYSTYYKSNKLSNIFKYLSNIYKFDKSLDNTCYQAILQEEQINFEILLAVNFYINALKVDKIYTPISQSSLDSAEIIVGVSERADSGDSYNRFLYMLNKSGEIELLLEKYAMEKITIRKIPLGKYVRILCKKYLNEIAKSPYINKFYKESYVLDTVQTYIKSANLYYKYIDYKPSDEACFNSIFSSQYTDTLIELLNNNDPSVIFYITPMRVQLSNKLTEGGKNIDHNPNSWGKYYNEAFKIEEDISYFEDNISKLKSLDKTFQTIRALDKAYQNIIKKIEYKRATDDYLDD